MKVIIPLVHFLHFAQSIVGESLNSKKSFSYTDTLFGGRSTQICMSSNLFRPLLQTFLCVFWPIFAFPGILHVCTLCVYPQVTQQVVSALKNDEVCTPSLFECHSTQICLTLNFFRILLHTFFGFASAILEIFGHFSHLFTCHFPQIISGWGTKPKKNWTKGHTPIWNMPHSNMHDFEFISNSIVHILRLCFGHF